MLSKILGKRKEDKHATQLNRSARPAEVTLKTGYGTNVFSMFGSNKSREGIIKQSAVPLKSDLSHSSLKNSMKKGSEPSMSGHRLSGVRVLQKSFSQPNISQDNLTPRGSRQNAPKSQNKPNKDESRGFLDRAFENAASLSFEEEEEAAGGADERPERE